jgi:type VI secretion system protein VasD
MNRRSLPTLSAGSRRLEVPPPPRWPSTRPAARQLALRRLLVLGFGALSLTTLTQCAPAPKPPPVLNLTITGTADQNPDTAGRASPVAVRIYQLAATAKFEQADVFALKDHEMQTLGPESMGSQEVLISPGDTKTVKVDLKPMVSSIGVAVMYRDIDAAKWRATESAAPNGPTNLTATVGKLALTLKPGS